MKKILAIMPISIGGRLTTSSIIDGFRENGFEIASGYLKPCDYLEVVERVFGLQGDL